MDSSWLTGRVWAAAAALEVQAFVNRTTDHIVDDHLAFLHEEIPAIDVLRYEHRLPRYFHTVQDDHRTVQPEGLEQVGRVVEAAVRLLDQDRDEEGR